jgi:hypothetical protein
MEKQNKRFDGLFNLVMKANYWNFMI